jgi:anti-sigma-K factor RskA
MSDDIHALAGAYALDALDELERARFEQHLARCSTCRDDVAGYRATATRLATASAEPAPAAVRSRVLSEITTVRQEPAAVRAVSRRRSLLAPVLGAAAALALVVGAVTLVDARNDRDRAEEVSAVVTADDATRIDLAGTPDGPESASGSVIWSASLGRAVVTLDGLPALDDGRAYALWFIVDGAPQPAALVDTNDGRVVATIDAPDGDVQAMGVTDEPAGGSAQPTTPILLAGSV